MVGTCMLLMLATGDWPRRVGEAAHPGPPSDDLELRRQRVLHALGQMQLLPPDTRPAALRDHHTDADAVETLSDRLSATTAFASPRGDAPLNHFRERWPQWHPTRRHQASRRHPRRTSRHAPRPLDKNPCLGKMPARRAPCPASETLGCTCLCCTQPPAT